MTVAAPPTDVTGPAAADPVWQLAALAGRAPSVHNTQPWSWRLRPGCLELYADWRLQLHHTDPTGRSLVVSCGAALHHVVVASHALGFAAHVTRFPDGEDSDLLARVDLSPGTRGAEEIAQLVALGSRRTDRRRFTSWPVPEAKLVRLAETAEAWGPRAVPVVDVAARWRLETLAAQAQRRQASDVAVVREHEEWLDHSDVDGVPRTVVPRSADRPGSHPPRFDDGVLEEGASDLDYGLDPADGIVVLGGPADDRSSWLATGMGLSALWLHAERGGLSVVPLSQVIEVAETRDSLALVLEGLTVPHLLVRVGWQPISRRELPRTPRRPLADLVRS